MANLSVREAQESDANVILQFIRDLAIYEKAEHEVKTDEGMILKTIFSSEAIAKALICELDTDGSNTDRSNTDGSNTVAIGFAVYFYSYSTWLGKKGLYLEDLYVSPEKRGLGAGKLLFQHLAAIAVKNDCARFEWRVLDWNESAIQFYEKMGAEAQSEWIGYRTEGKSLAQLASDIES